MLNRSFVSLFVFLLYFPSAAAQVWELAPPRTDAEQEKYAGGDWQKVETSSAARSIVDGIKGVVETLDVQGKTDQIIISIAVKNETELNSTVISRSVFEFNKLEIANSFIGYLEVDQEIDLTSTLIDNARLRINTIEIRGSTIFSGTFDNRFESRNSVIKDSAGSINSVVITGRGTD